MKNGPFEDVFPTKNGDFLEFSYGFNLDSTEQKFPTPPNVAARRFSSTWRKEE